MANSSFRLVKKPSPRRQFAAFRSEMVKQLQPVIDRRADEYSKATATWKPAHKPRFQGQVVLTQGVGPTFRVVIRNASKVINKYGTTIKQLWDIWNKGSRPHEIRPRFAKILRFTVDNTIVFTPLVRHPGTKGSKAKERIDKRLRRFEIRSVKRAGQRAWKKVNRLASRG